MWFKKVGKKETSEQNTKINKDWKGDTNFMRLKGTNKYNNISMYILFLDIRNARFLH